MTRTIDGSAGGGQILRSALALAGVAGEPVRVENVRGDRPNPGLKHQHRACVEAAAAVCDADVDGAELGSETVVFDPGEPAGGEVAVDVGTAGAVTLVFETVLPLSVALDEPLAVTATGGTDVAWSPTVDYYRRVRLPLARAAGWPATLDVDRRGFYPEGGGRATLTVEPGESTRVAVDERGDLAAARVHAVAGADLAADADVHSRLAEAATEALGDAGVDVAAVETMAAEDAPSTGAAVLVELDYAESVAGFGALGEPGRPAEAVGEAAASDALAFHEATGTRARDDGDGTPPDAMPSSATQSGATPPAVDEYAADQLVLPLALGGGRVRPAAITDHVRTNCAVARTFGHDVRVEDGLVVGE